MGWQIAIDGPAASGKSSVARALAEKLNFKYLDTGAMYRAVTLKALRLGINLDNESEYNFLQNTKFDFINNQIFLDDENVSKEIRTVEVSSNVSRTARLPFVRNTLVNIQRQIANSENIVMDGRDIGSVVLPGAFLKIFLYASLEVRAKRRLEERIVKGESPLTVDSTKDEIMARDLQDSNREISPLFQAEDAVFIDATENSIDEVVDEIASLVLKRGYKWKI